MSDVQMICQFIGSCPAVIQSHGAGLFNVLISSGCVYLPVVLHHFITCVTVFLIGGPFVHMLLW